MLCVQLLIKSTKITQIKHNINFNQIWRTTTLLSFWRPWSNGALLYFMKSQSPLVVSFMMSRALRPKPVGLASARPWLCLKKRVVYLQVTAIFQEKTGSKHDQKSWNFEIHYWQTCFDDVRQGEPEKISKKTTKQDGQHWVSAYPILVSMTSTLLPADLVCLISYICWHNYISFCWSNPVSWLQKFQCCFVEIHLRLVISCIPVQISFVCS
jgi:hypothetical protein